MGMFDYFKRDKLSRLFQAGLMPPEDSPQPMDEQARPNIPYYDNSQDATPSMDAYKHHVEEMPDRANYKTGKLQKVLAGVAGFGAGMEGGVGNAYSTTKGLLDSGYDNAMADYTRKGAGLHELAEIEEKTNTYKSKNRKDKFDADLALSKELRESGKTDAEIKNIQSEIANRGLRVIPDAVSGHSYIVDNTGKRTDLGSFAESLSNTRKYAEGEFNRQEGVRLGNNITLDDHRNANDLNRETTLANLRASLEKGNEDYKKSITGMSVQDQETALETAIKAAVLDNPAEYSKIIKDGKIDYSEIKSLPDSTKFGADVTNHLNPIKQRANKGNLLYSRPEQKVVPVTLEASPDEIAAVKDLPDNHDHELDNGHVIRKQNGQVTRIK